MNTKKYFRPLSLFGFSVVITVGVLFGMAATHHSDVLRLDNIPPACAAAVQQIHYPEKSIPTDDCSIRHWYNEQVKNIPQTLQPLQQQSVAISEQARCAFSLRHQLRMEARAAMPSTIEVDWLRVRDVFHYGHFDGPEFSQLVGKNPDESAYRRVIASATKTDVQVNEVCE